MKNPGYRDFFFFLEENPGYRDLQGKFFGRYAPDQTLTCVLMGGALMASLGGGGVCCKEIFKKFAKKNLKKFTKEILKKFTNLKSSQ